MIRYTPIHPSSLCISQHLPFLTSFSVYKPLSLISPAHMCQGVRLPIRVWQTYQWPHSQGRMFFLPLVVIRF